jgi:hypothetical protein
MAAINFSNERLRRAVEETKSAIGKRNHNLDALSEDIKQLESYLKRLAYENKFNCALMGARRRSVNPWTLRRLERLPPRKCQNP